MNQTSATVSPANGATAAHELFALTDEQILEIEPQAEVASDEWRVASKEPVAPGESINHPRVAVETGERGKADPSASPTTNAGSARDDKRTGDGRIAEPPGWLARQMKDPWVGEEACELWDGVLRAQAEAAEYRAAIATPAEAKTLKEIYPGGVEQARAAAERARALDEFDASYFGAAGKSAEEMSAARTALAQRMLREDAAAFREMVAAGIKALEELNVSPRSIGPSSVQPPAQSQDAGLKPGATQTPPTTSVENNAQVAAYGEFEKTANAELEKSVGGAVERALKQALPLVEQSTHRGGSQAGVPTLQERLGTAVRQEIEKALQGDRQLGEQVAQVLSSRRFDETARTQVVRLINERAQQLVPSATKRVLNDWTQTTLATHRSKTEKQEATASRADLVPAQLGTERAATGSQQRTAARADAPPASRGRVDYKKLSDEQILEL